MPDRLDADIAYLHVAGGRPLPDQAAGMAAFAAPRRAARGREKDLLILCLGLRSRSAPAAGRYDEMIQLAAVTFFGSTGSVTSALRQALAAANQHLLGHNLREGAGGAPIQGGMICAALRGEDFYAVQSGPGLVIVTHGGNAERFPNLPSRPLGLSDNVEAQYFHTAVLEGDYFCLSRHAPAGWDMAALSGLGGLATLGNVAERLKAATADDLAAILGRVEPAGAAVTPPAPLAAPEAFGRLARPPAPASSRAEPIKGGLSSLAAFLRPAPASEQPETAAPPVAAVPQAPEATLPEAPPAAEAPPPAEEAPLEEAEALPLADPEPEPIPAAPAPDAAPAGGTNWSSLMQRAERLGTEPLPSIPVIEEIPTEAEAQAAEASASARPGPSASQTARPQVLRQQAARGLGAFTRALGVTLSEMNHGLRVLLARMMPEGTLQKQGLFAVPTSVQIGIAIVIPLVVVAVAAMIYFQRGREEQFTDTFSQAQLEVATARASPDDLSARPHWEMALSWLESAEVLKPGDTGVAALRQEAQAHLDDLDAITRIDLRPLVVGGLGRDASVSRILLAGQDVYALDQAHNRVLRVTPSANNTGYVVDPAFECAGGTIGQFTIGEIMDIGLVPGPNVIGVDALVALDTAGGLLYCAPGAKPLATYLPTPDPGWIRPAAMEMYADRLYILDPGTNQVWQFLSAGGAFSQPPSPYFISAIYSLGDAVDFTIASGDLFLLRRDGRVTNCARPAGDVVTCTENVQFLDNRQGRAPGDRLSDVREPASLVYDPPPEPSLYLLDRSTSGLYQLSLKLALVRQYRASQPLPAPVACVTFDPAKQIYVGAGNNIYVAARP